MSGEDLLARLERSLTGNLTPTQRADNERFEAFWNAWPQTAADFDPDEWWRAEVIREAVLEVLGVETPVRLWAEWMRACELFDELYGFTREEN
jgi:hypothetical protein